MLSRFSGPGGRVGPVTGAGAALDFPSGASSVTTGAVPGVHGGAV